MTMSSKKKYMEAIRKAAEEGRTVDIGKAVAQMRRKPVDYTGTDIGSHVVNIFVGEHEGGLRIGEMEISISTDLARDIIRRLGK